MPKVVKNSLEHRIRLAFNAIGLDLHRLRPSAPEASKLVKSLSHFDIDTVFDIGANIGQFARSLRQAGYFGRIISFEPLSDAHEKLRNFAMSDPNWFIHPATALGNAVGDIEINISGNSVSSSLLNMTENHLNAAPESHYVAKEFCKIQTLDSIASEYTNQFNRVFLKIDTQGYEWEVLDGACKLIPNVQGILIEVSLVELYQGQMLWKEVINRLEKDGFTLWTIDSEFTDNLNGRTLQCNAVFFRV